MKDKKLPIYLYSFVPFYQYIDRDLQFGLGIKTRVNVKGEKLPLDLLPLGQSCKYVDWDKVLKLKLGLRMRN